jgi:hypothetical protein
MTLGDDPYTPVQLLNNPIRLLLGCGLYQRDFEEWDRKTAADKIWINLKPFTQEGYQLIAKNNLLFLSYQSCLCCFREHSRT